MKQLAAFVLICSVAMAEKPEPKISGPTERHPGALTFLDAGGSVGAEQFAWLVDTSGVSVPEGGRPDVSETVEQLRAMGFDVQEPSDDSEPLWAVSDDGKRLWLSSYVGTYAVTLGVSNADGISLLPWKVTVKGTAPVPPDPPIPVPVPIVEPTLPAGQFGLAIKMWRAAQGVQSANRPEEARKLAAALLGTLLEADGQKMVDAFAASVRTQFSEAQKAAWSPWRSAYLAELQALQQANKLNTKADFVTAFTEMSLGLSAVEK